MAVLAELCRLDIGREAKRDTLAEGLGVGEGDAHVLVDGGLDGGGRVEGVRATELEGGIVAAAVVRKADAGVDVRRGRVEDAALNRVARVDRRADNDVRVDVRDGGGVALEALVVERALGADEELVEREDSGSGKRLEVNELGVDEEVVGACDEREGGRRGVRASGEPT